MMIRSFGFLAALLFASITGIGQVVFTEPANPTGLDSVTVYFDASKGDGGLKGYTGDIWAHTGVLTSASGGPADWRYVVASWTQNTDKAKLSPLGNDLWELKIGPSIREYYGVPGDEIITHLNFVFRNSNGSRTGRDVNGADIFYELAILDVEIILPEKDWFIAEEGDRIFIEAKATMADSIFLYHDNELIKETAGNELSFVLGAQSGGKHDVEVIAKDSKNSVSDVFSYAVRKTYELPSGVRDGINYIDDNTVVLVLFAPAKDSVNVIGDFNSWEAGPGNLMKNTPDGNRFWLQVDNLEPGKEYLFQYLVDGYLQVADPYTEKTSDYNDQFISEETYPGLLMYPSNETVDVVSILQTAQEPYDWKIKDFKRPDQSNLIIYELLIRDFTEAHDYKTMTDTLDYLENLGITAIELMPPSEFEGNVSWGYNPSFYFAPDKFYGPKETFKAFVDACHERGIAVIIDMVLNHAYGKNPMVRLYWDEENNRPAGNNPWFNTVSPNPVYSWGFDFNHESDETKAFVDSVNRFWLQEYNIDGFRFDFTKGFTNSPGDGWFVDDSRIAILKRMADRIWEVEEDAYVILEHFAPFEEEFSLTDYGMMIWGNINYSYRKASSGYLSGNESDLSWGSYQLRGFSKPHLVSYMESHDEERLMYESLIYGRSINPDHNIKDLQVALKRMELSANFFIPLPGPKMIWMFGELGYDYSIDYNGRVGRKPIRWVYYDDPGRQKLYKIYSALNKLKTEHEVFQTTDYSFNLNDTLRRIHLNGDEMSITIIGNFGIWPAEGPGNFQHEGWWYEYWTGDSVNIENVNQQITFLPGEYRIYSDVRLDKPDISTSIKKLSTEAGVVELKAYPNPVEDRLYLYTGSIIEGRARINIIDITGRTVYEKEIPFWEPGRIEVIDSSSLRGGVYFVRLEVGVGVGVGRFIK